MNQLALYRKYRPQKFDEVLGQDHIVGILKNAVNLGRISHAYLFSGPRGTGKTSVARILAKEIGCANVDLIEIDAASSRGIDEIRALRESVNFVPLQGKVKVYIIDEAHMLTKEAFNALLKTLEEPPSHAVFMLATTELEKLPETIVSRCQNFSFFKIPENILKKSVSGIAKKEGFEIDDESAGLVALRAEGAFRDALGMLDQILSLADKNNDRKITAAEVREFLSAPAREIVEDLVDSLLSKDIRRGLLIVEKAAESNMDPRMLLKLVLRDIRSILLVFLAPDLQKDLHQVLSDREMDFILKYKDKSDSRELEYILKTLLDFYDHRSASYLPQVPLELALIKIANHSSS